MSYKDFNEMCKIEHKKMIKKLMNDPLIKKIIKECKEVKKMSKPYFETKVVKVKKEKMYSDQIIIDGKKYVLYEDENENVYPHKEKGNWVNGENLDKIKFPCFCSHSKDRYGIITKTYIGEAGEGVIYTMHHADKQYFSMSSIKSYNDLRKLIKAFNIHILKGKITIYEEEKWKE